MRENNRKQLLELSKAAGKFGDLAAGCVDEDGSVDHRALREKVEAAGMKISARPGSRHGVFVEVRDGEALVAHGFSSTERDALAHAVLGAVREEAAAKAVEPS